MPPARSGGDETEKITRTHVRIDAVRDREVKLSDGRPFLARLRL